jgi:homocysteine S-methyltransferase
MKRHGLGERFEEAYTTAFKLAKLAIEKTKCPAGSVQIAGCVPPLVASYVSEVSKDYAESFVEFQQIVCQQKNSVDLFLIETMSNIDEASAALDAVNEVTKPVYVSLTLSDDLSNTLRSGERLEDAISTLLPKNPDGILLNCSTPEAITKAMPLLAGSKVRFGGYANGFKSIEKFQPGSVVDVLESRSDLTPEIYTEYVKQWINIGATIVGGCCEIGPAHIKFIANNLVSSGHIISNLGCSKI